MVPAHSAAAAASNPARLHLQLAVLKARLANYEAQGEMLRKQLEDLERNGELLIGLLETETKLFQDQGREYTKAVGYLKESSQVCKELIKDIDQFRVQHNAGGERDAASIYAAEQLQNCFHARTPALTLSRSSRKAPSARVATRFSPRFSVKHDEDALPGSARKSSAADADGTVLNSLGELLQFAYGEDGAFIEKQNIDIFALNDEEFRHDYRVDVTDEEGRVHAGRNFDEEFAQLSRTAGLLRTYIFPRADATTSFYLPVNLQRIVQNATQIFRSDRRQPRDLEPAYIIDAVRELGERLVVVRGEDAMSKVANDDAVLRFRMHLRFATRRVLERFHLTRGVLGEVESKSNQSVVNPGEMCGTPAAQSIGEPATQMTPPRSIMLVSSLCKPTSPVSSRPRYAGSVQVTLHDTSLDWNQVQNVLRVQDWDGSVPTPAIVKPKPLWAGKQLAAHTARHQHPSQLGRLDEQVESLEKTIGASQLFTGLHPWSSTTGCSITASASVSATPLRTRARWATRSPSASRTACSMTIRESFESLVERQLNVARADSGQFAQKNLKEDTNVEEMVVAGSKGSADGTESLRKTIDALAQLKYDDRRKLIVVICDGMIVGSGNDRPTPRIMLDILGADPNLDPEPLSLLSLGEANP
ncbi:DNA-directed RNA polymerase subunit [Mycena kentingensis (nom. inval.)]|nr:DNA-directed RNA polymerase subunit [Mycena kentingensis (nom. inval.)]